MVANGIPVTPPAFLQDLMGPLRTMNEQFKKMLDDQKGGMEVLRSEIRRAWISSVSGAENRVCLEDGAGTQRGQSRARSQPWGRTAGVQPWLRSSGLLAGTDRASALWKDNQGLTKEDRWSRLDAEGEGDRENDDAEWGVADEAQNAYWQNDLDAMKGKGWGSVPSTQELQDMVVVHHAIVTVLI